MCKQDKESQKGVTLVELAVSVALIGLLLAGTLGGMNMIKASKIRKVVTEFTNYKTAIEEFESEYGYLPGDMPTASNFWSGANNGNGDTTVDWDGSIAVAHEDLFAWEHLALAGLIPGNYTGDLIDANVTYYELNVNAPASDAFTDSIYSFYTFDENIPTYGTTGHFMRISSLVSNGRPWGGSFAAKVAYSIDMKLDDGKASSGMLYTIRETTGCVTNPWTSTSSDYVLSSTIKDCEIFYWYKKF